MKVCTAVTFTLRENAANFSTYERSAATVARCPLAVNSGMPPVNMRVTSITAALSAPYAATGNEAMIGNLLMRSIASLPSKVESVATLLNCTSRM